jgi:hypothetical protein
MDKEEILSGEYKLIHAGLIDLSRAVRDYAISLPRKLEAMEEIFLQNNQYYDEIEIKKIRYFREAFNYKFYLANLHLEEIWSITHMESYDPLLLDILKNIYDDHIFTEDEIILPSFAFEGFILQGKAFLDFYMLYMCQIFKIDETHYLSGDRFINSLDNPSHDFQINKASVVKEYFEENIFGNPNEGTFLPNNWGEVLKKLRDSLVHRDILSPDFNNEETLLNQILGDWLELYSDLTCSRFCQDVQNVMHFMITTLAAEVYGLEYKPGPFKPGMWN